MTNKWPLQSAADSFYGNPRGKHLSHPNPLWEADNLIFMTLPYPMEMDGKKVTRIRVHKLCAPSLRRVLTAVRDHYYLAVSPAATSALHATGDGEGALKMAGVTQFDGMYTYRLMRGGTHLSMHSYGCAIDINAPANPFHSKKHLFQPGSFIVQAFEAEDWIWGGRWKNPDAMHFQAARVN